MRFMKATPIGTLSAERTGEERFAPGFCVDLWGAEKGSPKHMQPICRIEFAEMTNTIRVSVFADGDENAPVSVTDIPLNENLIGVVDKGKGVLMDRAGNRYMCDCDGAGHVMNEETGELLQVYCRNDHGVPVSLGPIKSCIE